MAEVFLPTFLETPDLRGSSNRSGPYNEIEKEIEKKVKDQIRAGNSSDVQLKRLKSPAYRRATRAFPACPLLAHQNVDACLTQAADAFCASVRLLKPRDALTCGAVDLRVLARIGWTRISEAAVADVEVFAALSRLHRGEGVHGVLVVGGWGQGLLEGRSLIGPALEGVLERRERGSGN